jgi:hypothetical protein
MFVLMLLLVTFLDFQRPVIEQQFVVSEIVESTITGCATNPQSGGFDSDPLAIEWRDQPAESVTETPLPLSIGSNNDPGGFQSMVFTVPENDSPPPIPATPEPPTVAILGITAIVLIFLLFGQRYGRRPSRYV